MYRLHRAYEAVSTSRPKVDWGVAVRHDPRIDRYDLEPGLCRQDGCVLVEALGLHPPFSSVEVTSCMTSYFPAMSLPAILLSFLYRDKGIGIQRPIDNQAILSLLVRGDYCVSKDGCGSRGRG